MVRTLTNVKSIFLLKLVNSNISLFLIKLKLINKKRCNRKTRATKQYSIRSAPNILVVHLKRFDFSYAGKLSHFVSYPETLNLNTFIPEASTKCSASNTESNQKSLRDCSYKLYSVLVHLGYTSDSGHYYSFVRAPNDSWYKADDERVSSAQTKDALGQYAYILFYSKIANNTNCNNSNIPKASNTSATTIPKQEFVQTAQKLNVNIDQENGIKKSNKTKILKSKIIELREKIRVLQKDENNSQSNDLAKLKRKLKKIKKIFRERKLRLDAKSNPNKLQTI